MHIRIFLEFIILFYGRPFDSKLWHDIRAVFFPTYTCNHSCYTIYVRFSVTYTCVLFPSIWPFSYKRAYICAQKIPYICATTKHVVYGVTESRRIRGTELYRQQKSPSCTMELKSNVSLNQAWPAIAALISSKICFLFIALTVVVVVGSPATDLLVNLWIVSWETVYDISQMLTETTIDSVRKLGRSDRQNTMTHKLLIQWNPVNTTTFGPRKFGRINGIGSNYGAKCF